MTSVASLATLYDAERGGAVPLPDELAMFYGRLQFPPHPGHPHVIGNFVSTLDGVVALQEPGHGGGAEISGRNPEDHAVMGLLRALADAVIVGAGTLRASPRHLWTAEHICPTLAAPYDRLRRTLGKSGLPLNVIVTAHGRIDPELPVFRSGAVPVLIVTTQEGLEQIRRVPLSPPVHVSAVRQAGPICAREVLEAVTRLRPCDLILVEGGPHLMADFFADQCLDELFLTLAPQIAGRNGTDARPGLVAGQTFAPDHPRWGTLVSVKRNNSHLFLRYSFKKDESHGK